LSSPIVPGREICVRIVRSRPGVGFQPPVSMGNVCVVLVIVPFLGSISGAPALFGIARIRDERNSPHVIVPSGMWLEFGVARPPVT